ncbi:YY1-associated protein 1 isoform X2 [Oryctolagus cuniculus]
MLPCKKRRSTVPESPQHKGQQEEVDVDLESAVNLDSAQVRELQSVSLCWGPSPDRRAGPEVACVQDAGRQAAAEDTPLSARTLTQDTHFPVLDGVDVDMAQGITLPALESSPSLDMHMGKGKFQATGSRRWKKMTPRPAPGTQEDRGDHLSKKEPVSGACSEEVREERGSVIENERETERSSICLFTSQISTTTMAGPGGGQEPRSHPGVAHMWQAKVCCFPEKEAEELFETFQDEMGFSNMEDDGPEEEEHVAESRPNFNTPQALRFEEPLANLLNEQHRTVKELLEQLKMKKSSAKPQQEVERVKPRAEKVPQTLILDPAQRKRLQQQMQQHVQLLTQIHLLAASNLNLSSEASTTKIFLKELGMFAQSSVALHHQFNPKFQTLFQPCNLMGAMQLIEDFSTHVSVDWSPRKTVKKTASEFPCLPKQVAWILATSKVFMYPELLPVCSLKAKNPKHKMTFTKAEDNLLALGLKHFEGTEFPKPLISKYLLTCKTAHQLTVRIKNLNMNRAPDNIIKFYKKTKQLPVLLKCCEEIQPHQWKPPVEREEHRLPFWLKASLPSIQDELRRLAGGAREAGNGTGTAEIGAEQGLEKNGAELGSETQYPLLLPKGVVLNLKPVANRFSRKAWSQKRSSVLKPLLIRPNPSLQPGFNPGKTPARSTQSEAPPSKIVRIPHLIHPATGTPAVPGVSPLGINGTDSFDSSTALPTMSLEARPSFPLSDSQTVLSSAPVPKIMLPSLGPSKFRKPCVRRRSSKRKGSKSSPCLKTAPLISPPPVIFTVPATTVKVVSLGSGCNVIQPVNAAVAQSPQTIPITTLLVNPTSFPCPLNQPLVASSISPLIVSSNSVNLPVPPTPEDEAHVNVDIACPLVEGQSAFQSPVPKLEPQELSPVCATVFPKEERSPGPPVANRESQEGLSENCAYWTVVKTEEGIQMLEPLPPRLQEHLNSAPGGLDGTVKVEPEDAGEEVSSGPPVQDVCDGVKEEHSVEMDIVSAGEGSSSARDVKKQTVIRKEGEKGPPAKAPSASQEPADEGNSGEVSRSPQKALSSVDPEMLHSSTPGKPEDSSTVDGQSAGISAGPETFFFYNTHFP